jgi:hypothetical protein
MIAGLNVDPSHSGGRVDPLRVVRVGANWVRFVSQDLPELHNYRDLCHEVGLRVLAVVARESAGYLLPECDMYQIGNEPDSHGPSSWTRTPAEYIEDLRIYRETYPTLPMIAAGFASGDPSYFIEIAPHLGGYAGYGVHPYNKTPSQALNLLRQYYITRPDLALWVTEWHREPDQIVPFQRMLALADAAFWFCALETMVPGFGLLDTPREQMWVASARS